MTDLTRASRLRRGNRRPGWVLLTALLVLAILASSALVFTNRVELLKLAVILALWAAVVAAFVSFIYRRQSDVDQSKARDLKLVYDLQLDREIAARHEYELSVESQLRRELTSELRSQAADEVASLRAELAALRANLEILFDTDLQHRPAIETERTSVHTFPDWSGGSDGGQDRSDRGKSPGRVISSRIDTEDRYDTDPNTEESPIIDVPIEPHPPEPDWISPADGGGAHRRPSEVDSPPRGWQPEPPPAPRRSAEPTPPPPPPPRPQQPAARSQWQEPEQPKRHSAPPEAPAEPEWRPAPAEGIFVPAGNPGSNWVSPVVDNGVSAPPAPPVPAPPAPPPPVATPPPPPAPTPEPAMTPTPEPAMTPPPEAPRGRHANAASTPEEPRRRARHSAPADADADPDRKAPPTLAPPPPPPAPTPAPTPEPVSERGARHRGAEEPEPERGQHVGGQPISELLARLQAGTTEGGRRRRREE